MGVVVAEESDAGVFTGVAAATALSSGGDCLGGGVDIGNSGINGLMLPLLLAVVDGEDVVVVDVVVAEWR